MFTGIIEDVGTVKNISASKLTISTVLDDIKTGDSIAVNGACLTAIIVSGGFEADYSPQTDKLTNLAALKIGSKVNLERALKLSSRLGGHIVSGHIDCAARIESIQKRDRFFRLIFSMPQSAGKYLAPKGSVAIDGISLTVSDIFESSFESFIIPHTFENTAMCHKKAGETVNIETDIIAKYLEKIITKGKSSASIMDALKENGFL